jgi:limonene-1,2-epoxide hydrolase
MPTTPTEILEAFSRHDFTSTFDHLADDIEWNNMGGDQHRGRAAVTAACMATTDALATTRTTFTRVRTITAGDTVLIDSQADYLDDDSTSTVASCDIYDFTDNRLTAITSYAIELPTSE